MGCHVTTDRIPCPATLHKGWADQLHAVYAAIGPVDTFDAAVRGTRIAITIKHSPGVRSPSTAAVWSPKRLARAARAAVEALRAPPPPPAPEPKPKPPRKRVRRPATKPKTSKPKSKPKTSKPKPKTTKGK
jgi:outer membrane biosynthesis protein TonB